MTVLHRDAVECGGAVEEGASGAGGRVSDGGTGDPRC